MDDLENTALTILDELQHREARLLSWGMVDGSFSYDELIDLIETQTDALDPDDVLDWLVDRALVVGLQEPEGCYRTRVAEGVRLFARLKQMFPGGRWTTAKELVSDFRFATLPRRYPDRCLDVGAVISEIAKDLKCTPVQQDVAYELLGGRSTNWKLADFQVEATRRVLAEHVKYHGIATIVCAGTGSGKTLAFYLPAFMRIAEAMTREPSTQCLAIYPRIELLRDQLKTAIENARRIDAPIRAQHGRPLSIGVLYGAVPKDGQDLAMKWHQKAWPEIQCAGKRARRCPYLDCPDCSAPLGWPLEHIQKQRERLVCSRCSFELPGEQLRLTRAAMSERPPDLLFSTTEMLNRGMANRALWPLLGIGDDVRAPTMVLLDEVHTYGGIPGAQVGIALRRWRHLARARPHYVGLSATLAEAPRFMAQLVGVHANHVVAVEPRKLITLGCEHIIALRGKPRAATLSTTIQATMLLRRLLDASPPKTEGIAGERVFVFTDNLDVTNRLYFQLADAEGWYRPHRPRRPAAHPPLASLRSSMADDPAARFRDGQCWTVVEEIGHSLNDDARAIIGRTSSQDAGVASDADVVVATASLEVGFDDPKVGGVVQHQAPRDPAAYVQRKGRAGRSREMRPWTVIVLSDWGRDRLAYRSYEHLFSPSVPPRHLPIKNRHVLRMQAALSFMDWLTERTPYANLWNDLRRPGKGGVRKTQAAIVDTLKRLLNDSGLRGTFAKHLQSSLGLDDAEEAAALLWEPPRSLVFSVWPTILRRLEAQWRRADGTLEPAAGHPLPEFIPRALFEDLNLPEVAIRLESARPSGDAADDEQWMPVRQALSEFAPGRVSRRYGVAHALDAHWVPPPEDFVGPLDLSTFCPDGDREALGTYQFTTDEEVREVEVFRPHRLHTKAPGRDIHERSNARPRWHTQIVAESPGTELEVSRGSAWHAFFEDIRFHTHVNGNPVEMRRFTTGADVRIRESPPSDREVKGVVRYQITRGDGASPAALGFGASIDAAVFTLALPESLVSVVCRDAELLRGVRIGLFNDALRVHPALEQIDVFQRTALAEAYLAALVVIAERDAISLEQARDRLAGGGEGGVIEGVVGALRPGDRVVGGGGPGGDEEIIELIEEPSVSAAFAEAASVLFQELNSSHEPWLRRSLKATIGGALLGACQRLCPQVDAGDLFVELSPGPKPDGVLPPDQVWLTEATVGGTGFIEAIQRGFAEDPRRFAHLIEAELEPSDFEDVDHYVRLLLTKLVAGPEHDAELSHSFAELRSADTFDARAAKFEETLGALRRRGVSTSHAVVSAVSLRLLRPGTSARTDELIAEFIQRLNAIEDRLGIELDDRCFAALLALDERVTAALARVFPTMAHRDDIGARHAFIAAQLWPRGSVVRRQGLAFWNPFEGDHWCDRLLLHAAVPHAPVTVPVEDADWRALLNAALLQHGRAGLGAPLSKPEMLREAVLELASQPVEADSLLLYARVRACKRVVGRNLLIFDMPEALQ